MGVEVGEGWKLDAPVHVSATLVFSLAFTTFFLRRLAAFIGTSKLRYQAQPSLRYTSETTKDNKKDERQKNVQSAEVR